MSAKVTAHPDAGTLTPAHLRAWRARADAEAERTFAACPWLRDLLAERLRARRAAEAAQQEEADDDRAAD